MVRQGLEKMGSPNSKIYRIHLDLVAKLQRGEIVISQKGKVWLHNCTSPEVLTISVEGHTLRLHESHKYSLIWTKMPFSNKLLTGISRQNSALSPKRVVKSKIFTFFQKYFSGVFLTGDY
jgi:hypothetical protein